MVEDPDAGLVALTGQGDAEAASRLVARHLPRMTALASAFRSVVVVVVSVRVDGAVVTVPTAHPARSPHAIFCHADRSP